MILDLVDPSSAWLDYELIDCGEFAKLERWGNIITARPEPQAVWGKSLSNEIWDQANHVFNRDKNNPEKGVWNSRKNSPEQWMIKYDSGKLKLKFRLGLSSFKHVGLFPEQSYNWDFIHDNTLRFSNPKILNLFAYTGGASIAAKAAHAEVTHVDSVKQVVTWAKENMLASGLDNIRWIVDDAMKFCQREVKRGNKYNGIILDPPAYGRGPDGEKWVLEDMIFELLGLCSKLLDNKERFVVINLYSMGLSPLVLQTLFSEVFGKSNFEFGELYFEDRSSKKLPLGIFLRSRFD